jgi:predicted nucleic acid-binding protein
LKYYLDSSLIVGFVLGESKARNFLNSINGAYYTSRLGYSEVIRSITKYEPARLKDAQDFLSGVMMLAIIEEVFQIVENYPREITLKTSDAIHVATAQLLLEEGDSLATLDKQMATNAERLGIPVLTFS